MPVFDIQIDIQDGERTYSEHELVIAEKEEDLHPYAKDLLENYYDGEGRFEDYPEIYLCKAWSDCDETCAEIGSIRPYDPSRLWDVNKKKKTKVKLVVEGELNGTNL